MPAQPSEPLTVRIPPELAARLERLADDQQRPVEEFVAEACRRYIAAFEAADRDERYARGYERIPEETSELEALLPHLPVPPETW